MASFSFSPKLKNGLRTNDDVTKTNNNIMKAQIITSQTANYDVINNNDLIRLWSLFWALHFGIILGFFGTIYDLDTLLQTFTFVGDVLIISLIAHIQVQGNLWWEFISSILVFCSKNSKKLWIWRLIIREMFPSWL